MSNKTQLATNNTQLEYLCFAGLLCALNGGGMNG